MFLMKREYWPKFSEHFSGFAGEEGYIHEKVRMNGGRVMFHKSLGWVHRFMRAKPITYRLDIIDKIYNYYIAYYEMNRNPNTVANFFKKGQPEDFVRRGMERALAVYPDLMTRFAHLPDVPEQPESLPGLRLRHLLMWWRFLWFECHRFDLRMTAIQISHPQAKSDAVCD